MFVWLHGMYVDRDNNLWLTDATVANAVPELAKQLKPALDAGYGHQPSSNGNYRYPVAACQGPLR